MIVDASQGVFERIFDLPEMTSSKKPHDLEKQYSHTTSAVKLRNMRLWDTSALFCKAYSNGDRTTNFISTGFLIPLSSYMRGRRVAGIFREFGDTFLGVRSVDIYSTSGQSRQDLEITVSWHCETSFEKGHHLHSREVIASLSLTIRI